MRLAMFSVVAAAARSRRRPAHAEGPKSEQTAEIMAGVGTGVSSALILRGVSRFERLTSRSTGR